MNSRSPLIDTVRCQTKRRLKYVVQRGCFDCGVDIYDIGHYYMVYDRIWAQTGLGRDNGLKLCLHCLAHRLGRRLRLDDFDTSPCNRDDDTRAAILDAVLGR